MSDILIKGMEMPSCGLTVTIYPDGRVVQFLGYGEKKQLGTAIPVPPHGRLGDLDEFAKVVLNWIASQEKAYPNEDSNALSWRLGARAMGHQIYRDIEAAPTIVPADKEDGE